MKTIIILLLLLGTQTLYAQNCKPYKKQKDKFAGVTYYYYGGRLDQQRALMAGSSTYVSFHVFKQDTNIVATLRLDIYQGLNDASVNAITIGKGSQFMIRTKSGIIEFTAETIVQKKAKMGDKIITVAALNVILTKAQLTFLQNNPILAYQVIPIGYSNMQGTVKEGKAKKVHEQLKCFKG